MSELDNDSNTTILSGLSLNPNAGTFVPRATAKPFVPTWLDPAAADVSSSSSSSGIDFNEPPSAAGLNKSIGGVIDISASSSSALLNRAFEAERTSTPVSALAPPTPKAATPIPGSASPAPRATASRASGASPAPRRAAAATAASAGGDDDLADEDTMDQETLTEFFGKEHMNVLFIGHVDAGKSTMGGRILEATGMVDRRTLERFEREAREAGRDSWYLSWALDTNAEERAKGKTVEVGRAYFETETRRYTILDAPGHKTYVPNMIGGAAQADIAVLVVSARKGEFEAGYEKSGQTREHAVLAKNGGVNQLIVVVNKMDDSTVEWSKERYDEIVDKLSPFLKANRYNLKRDVMFMPVSGYTGANIKNGIDPKVCDWYSGPTLLGYLDSIKISDRKLNAPLRIPVSEKYKDMGTIVVGKIEAGSVTKGAHLLMMPNAVSVEVAAIFSELEEEIPIAGVGDNIRLRLRGIEEEDIMLGFVLCSPNHPVHAVTKFEAALGILDLENIITAGYTAVLHIHNAIEEITLSALLHGVDKKTGRKTKRPPQFLKKGEQAIVVIETEGSVCAETFADSPHMGRFTLRDKGKTIAIGKITKLHGVEEQE